MHGKISDRSTGADCAATCLRENGGTHAHAAVSQVIQLGEEGVILAYNPGGDWSVRCQQGAYLLGETYLEAVEP